MTRLARTTGRAGMNLGDKSARVYLELTLGLRTDKRPAWKQLWPLQKPVYNSVWEKEGERGASAQKRPTKHTMRPQWRMNYSRRLRHGLEDPFTERKWPFSPTKCFLFGLAKEAACHSGGQLKPLKSTHVRPKDARLLPGKRTRIKWVKHTLWVCHVPFKLTKFAKQCFSADLSYKSGLNFIS